MAEVRRPARRAPTCSADWRPKPRTRRASGRAWAGDVPFKVRTRFARAHGRRAGVPLWSTPAALPVLVAMKVRGLSVYSHAAPGHPLPTTLEEVGKRHRGVSGGGNLRAAVFGVNDGLVSNASLILGVAGASANNSIILLSGVAGLLAGAFSMAAGEYVSVR